MVSLSCARLEKLLGYTRLHKQYLGAADLQITAITLSGFCVPITYCIGQLAVEQHGRQTFHAPLATKVVPLSFSFSSFRRRQYIVEVVMGALLEKGRLWTDCAFQLRVAGAITKIATIENGMQITRVV